MRYKVVLYSLVDEVGFSNKEMALKIADGIFAKCKEADKKVFIHVLDTEDSNVVVNEYSN